MREDDRNELRDAATDVAIELGLELAHQVLIPWIRHLVKRAINPQLAFSDADVIVRGLDYTHPDWSWEKKAQWARDALTEHLHARGGWPTQADVNQMIEVAVTKAKQLTPGATAPQP